MEVLPDIQVRDVEAVRWASGGISLQQKGGRSGTDQPNASNDGVKLVKRRLDLDETIEAVDKVLAQRQIGPNSAEGENARRLMGIHGQQLTEILTQINSDKAALWGLSPEELADLPFMESESDG